MIVINEAKVRYTYLDEILKPFVEERKLASNNMNVVLDLKDVFRKIFRESAFDENILLDKTKRKNLLVEMSSDIINIIGHYRNYNYKHLKKYTNFFIIYSYNECDHLKNLYSGYKETYYKKYHREDGNRNKIIENSLNIIKTVVDLIPHTYFIDSTKYDDAVWFNYLSNKFSANDITVFLSNDPVVYQCLKENTIGINMKGLSSRAIQGSDVYDMLIPKLKTKSEFSHKLYGLVLAIAGVKKYDIKGIKGYGYGKAVRVINKMIKDEEIVDEVYLNLNDLEDCLRGKFSAEEIDIIKNNYRFLCLEYYKTHLREYELDYNYKSSLENRPVTYNGLMDVNNKFFQEYPLIYDMLFKGEKH